MKEDGFIEGLFRANQRKLSAYLTRILGNPAVASEVAQDSFVALQQAYKPGELQFPRAALFKTAKNFALMQLRRRRIEARSAAEVTDIEEVSDCGIPYDRQIMADQLAKRLATVITELPATLRGSFVLAYLEGKPRTEIASIFGVTEKRLDKRLSKALRLCRDRLSLEGIGAADFHGLDHNLISLVHERVLRAPPGVAPRPVPSLTGRKKRPPGSVGRKRRRAKEKRLAASFGLAPPTDPIPVQCARVAVQMSGTEVKTFGQLEAGLQLAVSAAITGRRVKVITMDTVRARFLILQLLTAARSRWPSGLELATIVRSKDRFE
jgi:RNA polymerase sigma-70 factor (ECF subfamily)